MTANKTVSLPARQKNAPPVRPSARPKTPPESKKAGAKSRKKSWPIMEVVLVLLLIKISAGAYFLLSGPKESDRLSQDPTAALESIAAKAALTVSQSLDEGPPPALEAGKSESYLAAAAQAVSPSVAQAASVAAASPATGAYSAVSAGALMVVGGQASASGMAQGASDSIPLPPGGSDLLSPAAELPPPVLPSLGGSRDMAPLPPQSASPAAAMAPDSEALRALRDREAALAQKEASLATREEALGALDRDLRSRMAAYEASRNEMESMVRRNEAILAEQKAYSEQQKKDDQVLKDARIQHLVAAYKGMKAEQAGLLVNSLDDGVAVDLFSAMPPRNAGQILQFVDPEKAARITKAISERRIDPALLGVSAQDQGGE